MSGNRDDDEDQGVGQADGDQRFVATMRMRVRAKNPQIERKATLRQGSDTATLSSSESGSEVSLYDRIEQTEPAEELDAARAQLDAALWTPETSDGTAAPKTLAAPRAENNPAQTSTGRVAPDRLPTEVASAAVSARAPNRRQRPAQRPAAPRSVQDRSATVSQRPTPIDDEETVVGSPPPTPQKRPNPVPRARLVGGGTKAAAADVRRQQILREANLPDLRTPALKLYAGEVELHRLHRLDAALAGELDDPAMAEMSLKRALEHLIYDRAFAELAHQDRASFLSTVADSEEGLTTIKAALAIAKTGVLTRLDDGARSDLHAVFRGLDLEGRARFARLAARHHRNRSVLEDRDTEGRLLLEHLRVLIDHTDIDPWWPSQGLRLDVVFGLILGTLAQPVRLSFEDSADGVVGVLEFSLADTRPAELARLWRATLGIGGIVNFSGGLQLTTATLKEEGPRAPTPLRGVLLALANKVRVGPRRSGGAVGHFTPGGRGFDANLVAQSLNQLFGCPYSVSAGATAGRRQLARLSSEPDRAPPAFVSVLYEQGERLFVFDRLTDEHIYLRGPQGQSVKRTGARRTAPDREAVDTDRGIDRIALDSFQDAAGVVLCPVG